MTPRLSWPSSTIDSGQRSRTSRTKGRFFRRAITAPASPQKNWGLVETITSGSRTRREARIAVKPKRT